MFFFKRSRSARVLALLAIAAGWQTANATTSWSENPATPDDWFDSSAWSNGLPSASLGATIDNGGQVTISSGAAIAGGVQIGTSTGGNLTVSGGELTSGTLLIWPGLVNQTGGRVHASTLELGNSFSGGAYQLSGTGQLSVDNDESIYGQFVQNGGNNNALTLSMGNGSYQLTNGELETYNGETIGSDTLSQEPAQFIQSGGINYLGSSNMSVLDIAHGTYEISAGELSADKITFAATPYSQSPGNGSFLQSGGNVSAGNYGITLFGGTYTMNGGTLTSTTGATYIGGSVSSDGTFIQNGGASNLFTLEVDDTTGGGYVLGSGATLQAQAENIGYKSLGSFMQTGGTNITGSLTVGNANTSGSYSLLISATLQSGNEYIGNGGLGTATFIQNGSINNLAGFDLYVGNNNGMSSYTMNGSSQTWTYNEYIGYNVLSNATFTQNGGTNSLSGSLILGYGNVGSSNYLLNGGQILAQSELVSDPGSALFSQAGGTNVVNNLTINAGGRFNLLYGVLQITKSFSNSGTFDLQNPAAAGLSGTNILNLGTMPITNSTTGGTGTLDIEQNAALYAGSITQGSLIIGGKIQIAPQSPVSKINSLDITTGSLDITDNELIVDYATTGPTPLPAIRSYLHSGYANNWTGSGIISSTAAGNPAVAIGYSENSALGLTTFGGATVDSTAILIRYTWVGDANLDGKVDATDLSMIQSNGTTWDTGDFNYDGVVNADDYALFNLGLAESGGNPIPVPEPAAWGIFTILLLARKRLKNI
ncbi:MAG TPA: hypothetical protein VGG19_18490 [Tepidisphaeraceae bacterium]|jgi:hypothetical protein